MHLTHVKNQKIGRLELRVKEEIKILDRKVYLLIYFIHKRRIFIEFEERTVNRSKIKYQQHNTSSW